MITLITLRLCTKAKINKEVNRMEDIQQLKLKLKIVIENNQYKENFDEIVKNN
jgi:hypothetical protein